MKKSTKLLGGHFDRVYQEVLLPFFDEIEDPRRDNSSYSLNDALRSGFALYSLKSPSLYSFRQRSEAEDSNLGSVFGIREIPSDNGLRKILDSVPSDLLRDGFGCLFDRLHQIGLLDEYRYWNDHLVVSVDGVEHFCSKKVSCPYCMTRSHRDGTTSHYHSMLSAAIVCPGEAEVFVLDNEPIVKQDGQQKNDCERNAAKRLLDNLQRTHGQESIVYVMDALYSCGPIIGQLNTNPNWRYVIGITEKGNRSLFEQFDQANEQGEVHWEEFQNQEGSYSIGYLNHLSLNQSSPEINTNMLYCVWTDKKGKETIFSWTTNIKLTKRNIRKVMRMGRSRWKIENEVFNTLKNQQYHFEHNFGHGEKYLCTNFAFLMMMAFTVDQIQQRVNQLFQALLQKLKTKVKLWESLRAVFKIIPCNTMNQLYLQIANIYRIQIE